MKRAKYLIGSRRHTIQLLVTDELLARLHRQQKLLGQSLSSIASELLDKHLPSLTDRIIPQGVRPID